ncbi:MAG: nucleoside triphosphate pyrophosphohydrolase [Anaerolineae bacterium]
MKLTIVGLGPGELDDLSRKAWRVLKQARVVYLRTTHHQCVPCLPQNDAITRDAITYHSFDSLYEAHDRFEDVYSAIVETLLAAAQTADVVYAVPGDPMVGESTTQRLLKAAPEAGIEVEIVNGISFIEPMLRLAGIDALDGLQIFDGLEIAAMHHPPINPDMPALVGQVYSRHVASNVKLTLMNQYPDDFRVKLIHGAGTDHVIVEDLPLYEIDRSAQIQHMTSLYVPALGDMASFERFQEIIAHLRAPEGCPWDQKQTHDSLRKYLLEETYEVLEAIDAGDARALAEELGDLLLQIVLHTQIAIDDGEFNMVDVLRHINHKMIRRHPHVWSTVTVEGADEVVTNWEAIKQQEKAAKGIAAADFSSVLDGIPKGLPALMQADKYQAKAARVGFDWDDIAPVRAKIDEEIAEVEALLGDASANAHELHKEMGDLLFSVVNWARWLKIEPETALREANARFYRRFTFVEQAAAKSGKLMEEHTLAELDVFWAQAKAQGL